ncbi:RAP domain-containing protein [Toxoplasma gondii TgCatPRC2]|uniref:RAP domain-containing protein n=1 Tax=Toxoplasma gondii TgCatPRC2 TaxID=1130821 RepID=A0A151HA20_TOXGO|nr:RAP domain-containing protein [Toxoplasma gondii TgCatPRC2]
MAQFASKTLGARSFAPCVSGGLRVFSCSKRQESSLATRGEKAAPHPARAPLLTSAVFARQPARIRSPPPRILGTDPQERKRDRNFRGRLRDTQSPSSLSPSPASSSPPHDASSSLSVSRAEGGRPWSSLEKRRALERSGESERGERRRPESRSQNARDRDFQLAHARQKANGKEQNICAITSALCREASRHAARGDAALFLATLSAAAHSAERPIEVSQTLHVLATVFACKKGRRKVVFPLPASTVCATDPAPPPDAQPKTEATARLPGSGEAEVTGREEGNTTEQAALPEEVEQLLRLLAEKATQRLELMEPKSICIVASAFTLLRRFPPRDLAVGLLKTFPTFLPINANGYDLTCVASFLATFPRQICATVDEVNSLQASRLPLPAPGSSSSLSSSSSLVAASLLPPYPALWQDILVRLPHELAALSPIAVAGLLHASCSLSLSLSSPVSSSPSTEEARASWASLLDTQRVVHRDIVLFLKQGDRCAPLSSSTSLSPPSPPAVRASFSPAWGGGAGSPECGGDSLSYHWRTLENQSQILRFLGEDGVATPPRSGEGPALAASPSSPSSLSSPLSSPLSSVSARSLATLWLSEVLRLLQIQLLRRVPQILGTAKPQQISNIAHDLQCLGFLAPVLRPLASSRPEAPVPPSGLKLFDQLLEAATANLADFSSRDFAVFLSAVSRVVESLKVQESLFLPFPEERSSSSPTLSLPKAAKNPELDSLEAREAAAQAASVASALRRLDGSGLLGTSLLSVLPRATAKDLRALISALPRVWHFRDRMLAQRLKLRTLAPRGDAKRGLDREKKPEKGGAETRLQTELSGLLGEGPSSRQRMQELALLHSLLHRLHAGRQIQELDPKELAGLALDVARLRPFALETAAAAASTAVDAKQHLVEETLSAICRAIHDRLGAIYLAGRAGNSLAREASGLADRGDKKGDTFRDLGDASDPPGPRLGAQAMTALMSALLHASSSKLLSLESQRPSELLLEKTRFPLLLALLSRDLLESLRPRRSPTRRQTPQEGDTSASQEAAGALALRGTDDALETYAACLLRRERVLSSCPAEKRRDSKSPRDAFFSSLSPLSSSSSRSFPFASSSDLLLSPEEAAAAGPSADPQVGPVALSTVCSALAHFHKLGGFPDSGCFRAAADAHVREFSHVEDGDRDGDARQLEGSEGTSASGEELFPGKETRCSNPEQPGLPRHSSTLFSFPNSFPFPLLSWESLESPSSVHPGSGLPSSSLSSSLHGSIPSSLLAPSSSRSPVSPVPCCLSSVSSNLLPWLLFRSLQQLPAFQPRDILAVLEMLSVLGPPPVSLPREFGVLDGEAGSSENGRRGANESREASDGGVHAELQTSGLRREALQAALVASLLRAAAARLRLLPSEPSDDVDSDSPSLLPPFSPSGEEQQLERPVESGEDPAEARGVSPGLLRTTGAWTPSQVSLLLFSFARFASSPVPFDPPASLFRPLLLHFYLLLPSYSLSDLLRALASFAIHRPCFLVALEVAASHSEAAASPAYLPSLLPSPRLSSHESFCARRDASPAARAPILLPGEDDGEALEILVADVWRHVRWKLPRHSLSASQLVQMSDLFLFLEKELERKRTRQNGASLSHSCFDRCEGREGEPVARRDTLRAQKSLPQQQQRLSPGAWRKFVKIGDAIHDRFAAFKVQEGDERGEERSDGGEVQEQRGEEEEETDCGAEGRESPQLRRDEEARASVPRDETKRWTPGIGEGKEAAAEATGRDASTQALAKRRRREERLRGEREEETVELWCRALHIWGQAGCRDMPFLSFAISRLKRTLLRARVARAAEAQNGRRLGSEAADGTGRSTEATEARRLDAARVAETGDALEGASLSSSREDAKTEESRRSRGNGRGKEVDVSPFEKVDLLVDAAFGLSRLGCTTTTAHPHLNATANEVLEILFEDIFAALRPGTHAAKAKQTDEGSSTPHTEPEGMPDSETHALRELNNSVSLSPLSSSPNSSSQPSSSASSAVSSSPSSLFSAPSSFASALAASPSEAAVPPLPFERAIRLLAAFLLWRPPSILGRRVAVEFLSLFRGYPQMSRVLDDMRSDPRRRLRSQESKRARRGVGRRSEVERERAAGTFEGAREVNEFQNASVQQRTANLLRLFTARCVFDWNLSADSLLQWNSFSRNSPLFEVAERDGRRLERLGAARGGREAPEERTGSLEAAEVYVQLLRSLGRFERESDGKTKAASEVDVWGEDEAELGVVDSGEVRKAGDLCEADIVDKTLLASRAHEVSKRNEIVCLLRRLHRKFVTHLSPASFSETRRHALSTKEENKEKSPDQAAVQTRETNAPHWLFGGAASGKAFFSPTEEGREKNEKQREEDCCGVRKKGDGVDAFLSQREEAGQVENAESSREKAPGFIFAFDEHAAVFDDTASDDEESLIFSSSQDFSPLSGAARNDADSSQQSKLRAQEKLPLFTQGAQTSFPAVAASPGGTEGEAGSAFRASRKNAVKLHADASSLTELEREVLRNLQKLSSHLLSPARKLHLQTSVYAPPYTLPLVDSTYRIAFEIATPENFFRDPEGAEIELTAWTSLRHELLHAQGWCVVAIPHFEWTALPDRLTRLRYLQRQLLKAVLSRNSPSLPSGGFSCSSSAFATVSSSVATSHSSFLHSSPSTLSSSLSPSSPAAALSSSPSLWCGQETPWSGEAERRGEWIASEPVRNTFDSAEPRLRASELPGGSLLRENDGFAETRENLFAKLGGKRVGRREEQRRRPPASEAPRRRDEAATDKGR